MSTIWDSQAMSSSSPTETYAALNRQWWEDQQSRYQPLEDMANDMVLNPEKREAILQSGLDKTTDAVNNSFERADNRLETLRSRTNQMQTERSKSSNSRLNALNKTATGVAARNSAREYIEDTETRMIG